MADDDEAPPAAMVGVEVGEARHFRFVTHLLLAGRDEAANSPAGPPPVAITLFENDASSSFTVVVASFSSAAAGIPTPAREFWTAPRAASESVARARTWRV